MAERVEVRRDGVGLAGVRWPGGDRTVVLLHEGVADSRGWASVADLLAPEVTVVAYDRRGYGLTPASTEPFSHVDDLLAVLDSVSASHVWLVGASIGGGLALDVALAAPLRVDGLVVMGTAVSGAPQPSLDPATERFDHLLDKAYESCEVDEINRLETWLWLDGPAQPEGRVGGVARELALDMNAVIIRNDVPEDVGGSGLDAWNRLAEIQVPVTVACGDLDVPFIVERCRVIAERLPQARHRVLPGLAHQPYLESAETVAELIRSAMASWRLGTVRLRRGRAGSQFAQPGEDVLLPGLVDPCSARHQQARDVPAAVADGIVERRADRAVRRLDVRSAVDQGSREPRALAPPRLGHRRESACQVAAQSSRLIMPRPCGAGDGNRTRTVSLGS